MAAVHPTLQDAAPSQDFGALDRLLADTLPLMVWTADAAGGVDFVNRRTLEYTGLEARALTGWEWEAVVHPEDRAQCRAAWQKALADGARCENEMRLRRADGSYRRHHGSAVPVRDRHGRVTRWFGIATDVEDDARKLRAAQSRLRALIDTEPECVKLLDAQGRLLEMNAAGLRMIEAERADAVLGRCVYGLIVPEHAAAFRGLTERVCRGERGTLEFEMVGLKGTRRWLETHAVPFQDEASGETRLLAITRDVTERRRVEVALRESEQALAGSEQRFRTFMDNAPAIAWIKDASLRYTYVNAPFERYHRRPASEVLGRDDTELFADEMATYIRSHDEDVRNAGAALQGLRRMPHDDGSIGHWLTVKFPFPDAAGGTGIAGFAIDVRARVEAEDKARRYAEDIRSLVNRLVQTQEAERRRVADELHDLIGQNLTALGIDLQSLKQKLQAAGDTIAGPRLDEMASLVETTIDAIRGVMTDLRPAALEEFGLVPALRWYASVFSQRTKIKVTTSATGYVLRLPRDTELAVFRIVQEALTNAAKHSGGSEVKISIRYGEGLLLMVEDDGKGFSEISSLPGAKRGGFGLTTMRERAEAHGGRLRVESTRHGSRVVLEIPQDANAD